MQGSSSSSSWKVPKRWSQRRKTPTAWNALYFLFLLVSLVLLGGILENRRIYLILEAARLLAVAGIVQSAGGPFALVSFALLSLAWLLTASRSTAPREVADPVSC